MRFASKSQEFNRTVRQPKFDRVRGPSGETEIVCTREGIMAQFAQAGLTEHEKAQVKERFTFLGQYEGEDPMRRVSIYDTDLETRLNEWDDETKKDVEANLLEGQGEFYFLLDEQRQPKPWPNYDNLRSADKIAEIVKEQGYDSEAVIAYERENKNRDAVLEALAPESVVTA